MMLLIKFFSNKSVQKVLEVIFWIIVGILAVALVLTWISVPVWCLTHHINHSHFTWYAVWVIWSILAIVAGIILAALADS